jgi:hypothetical protein
MSVRMGESFRKSDEGYDDKRQMRREEILRR